MNWSWAIIIPAVIIAAGVWLRPKSWTKRRSTPFHWVLFSVICLMSAFSLINSLSFYFSADRTAGIVQTLESENSRCSKADCTLFWAVVSFENRNHEKKLAKVYAGEAKFQNQPVELAELKVKQTVDLLSDAEGDYVLRESFHDLWQWPLAFLGVGLLGIASCWWFKGS